MEDMAERNTEPGAGKPFRRAVGKLLLIVAGMGAVVLVVFVAQPMLTAPAPEPPAMAPAEIVAEVLSEPPAEERVELSLTENMQPEELPAMPTPLMAVRHGGEEVPVVFPGAEEPAAGEDAGPSDSLPAVLSPEEIEGAVAIPVPANENPAGAAPAADKAEGAGEQVLPATVVAQASVGSARTVVPPPEATREVQELLQSLGYEPGPADGIWGDRTARAWKNFARDTSHMDAGTGLVQVPPPTPGPAGAPTRVEEPSAPSGGAGAGTAHGARQEERMRVPGTLRGVMGYRLPLVSRQEVPDQIVSGVLIPAHTTFVILRGGEWELTGVEPHEVERLEGERAGRQPEALGPKTRPEPQRRGWNPLLLFRRQPASMDAK